MSGIAFLCILFGTCAYFFTRTAIGRTNTMSRKRRPPFMWRG